jgi:hypothetical protein
MEKQECVSLELLTSYKIFNAKVNIAKVLRSSNKVPVFLFDFKEICVSRQILIKVPDKKLHENLSRGTSTDTCG